MGARITEFFNAGGIAVEQTQTGAPDLQAWERAAGVAGLPPLKMK